MRHAEILANTRNNSAPGWPAFANAHAVLASSCELKSHTRRSTAIANVMNSFASDYPSFANAQAVLARSAALK